MLQRGILSAANECCFEFEFSLRFYPGCIDSLNFFCENEFGEKICTILGVKIAPFVYTTFVRLFLLVSEVAVEVSYVKRSYPKVRGRPHLWRQELSKLVSRHGKNNSTVSITRNGVVVHVCILKQQKRLRDFGHQTRNLVGLK